MFNAHVLYPLCTHAHELVSLRFHSCGVRFAPSINCINATCTIHYSNGATPVIHYSLQKPTNSETTHLHLSGARFLHPSFCAHTGGSTQLCLDQTGGRELPTEVNLNGTALALHDQIMTEVWVGHRRCRLLTLSNSYLSCVAPEIHAGSHTINVLVPDVGLALHSSEKSASIFDQGFYLRDLSPRNGSLAGGTYLTLTGGGFVAMPGEADPTLVSMLINASPPVSPFEVDLGEHGNCTVVGKPTSSSVICETPRANLGAANLSTFVQAVAPLVGSSDLLPYGFTAALTPRVLSIKTTRAAALAKHALTLSGSGFGNFLEGLLRVWMGTTLCDILSQNDTVLTCLAAELLPAGDHVVQLHRAGWGYAQATETHGAKDLPHVLKVTLELGGLYAASSGDEEPRGSLAGGQLLNLTGSGFSSVGMTVSACGKQGRLEEGGLSPGLLQFRSPSMLVPTNFGSLYTEHEEVVRVTDNSDLGSMHMFNIWEWKPLVSRPVNLEAYLNYSNFSDYSAINLSTWSTKFGNQAPEGGCAGRFHNTLTQQQLCRGRWDRAMVKCCTLDGSECRSSGDDPTGSKPLERYFKVSRTGINLREV